MSASMRSLFGPAHPGTAGVFLSLRPDVASCPPEDTSRGVLELYEQQRLTLQGWRAPGLPEAVWVNPRGSGTDLRGPLTLNFD